MDADTDIVIKGRFPYVRHFSFTVANSPTHRLVDSVAGREFIPDPGSTNPFLPGANWGAQNRNYTLKVRFTNPPEESNHFVPGAGNNVIYAGTLENGEPNRPGGLIILRVYVPSIGYDKTGGVDLPFITYCPAKKGKRHLSSSYAEKQEGYYHSEGFFDISQQNNHDWDHKDLDDEDDFNFINSKVRKNKKKGYKHSCDLTWRRFKPEFAQPEGNTVYTISNRIDRDPGKLLLIRWKAPTFPDTYHNIGIAGNEDMQYWSMNFITPIGLLGLSTISDYQTIIDKKGYVNLVISFGAQRPSGVTPENGFTWVDASQLPLVPLFLIYRNNQISQNFPYTAEDVPKNKIVTPQDMGKYYPCGEYVDPNYFNSCCDHEHYKE
ncbi:hypothetical protein [Salipaludibacillus aurantiacus]|uniref:hypothetical protein n=1 Tax=Salipaludibacillus aurantiacus TaxID=1601833 RepID=UPI000B830978|nr:hypothetical protein [Salipaludibacillus aurantiacus]